MCGKIEVQYKWPNFFLHPILYPAFLRQQEGGIFPCILSAGMLSLIQGAAVCQRLAVIPTIPDEGRWCYGYIFGAVSASYVPCGICRSDFSDFKQKKMTAQLAN